MHSRHKGENFPRPKQESVRRLGSRSARLLAVHAFTAHLSLAEVDLGLALRSSSPARMTLSEMWEKHASRSPASKAFLTRLSSPE